MIEQQSSEINTEQGFPFTEGKSHTEGKPFTPPPAPAATPQRIRRVGTLTMGLSLIAAGVIAMICLFRPSFDIVMVLRFAPLVLIFLGAEILISHLLFSKDRLKYDFLSGVVCFLLICASVGVSMVPPLYEQFGPKRERIRSVMTQQVYDLCYEALGQSKSIRSLQVNVYLNGSTADYQNLSVQSLGPMDKLFLTLELSGDYTEPRQFAQDVREILDRLEQLSLSPDDVDFFYNGTSSEETPLRYRLDLGDPFAMRQSAEQLAQMVEHDDTWKELEAERRALEEEREALYRELEEQHSLLNTEIESERMALEEEREALYRELEEERQQLRIE